MTGQPDMPSEFLDLRGQPAVVSFLAMEYYAVVMNRTFAVIVTRNSVCGAKMFGAVASPRGAISAYRWRDPRNFISSKTRAKYESVDPESPAFLAIDKDNFRFPCGDVKGVGFTSRKKVSMGGIPHSGSLFLWMADGRKREFILLGNQDGSDIETRMLAACVSAAKTPV